jgi:hypothetical protein
MPSFTLLAINARFAEPITICRLITVSRTRSRGNRKAERRSLTKFSAVHAIEKSLGPVSTVRIGCKTNRSMCVGLAIGPNLPLTVTSRCSSSDGQTLSG